MMPTMVLLVSVLTIWIPKIFLFNTFSYLEREKKSGVGGGLGRKKDMPN